MRPAVEPPARRREECNRTIRFRVSGDVCVFPSLLEERMPKMRKTLVSLCAATALLFTGTAVQAQSIPWGYSATDYVTYSGPIKTSSITFQGRSGAPNGDSGIIIYNLTTQYNGDGTPDAFTGA